MNLVYKTFPEEWISTYRVNAFSKDDVTCTLIFDKIDSSLTMYFYNKKTKNTKSYPELRIFVACLFWKEYISGNINHQEHWFNDCFVNFFKGNWKHVRKNEKMNLVSIDFIRTCFNSFKNQIDFK